MKEKKEMMKEESKKKLESIEEEKLAEKVSIVEIGSNFVKPDMEENDGEDIKDIVKQIEQSDVVSEEEKQALKEGLLRADKIIQKTDGGKSVRKQEQRKEMTKDLQNGIGKNKEMKKMVEKRDNSLDEKSKKEDPIQEI